MTWKEGRIEGVGEMNETWTEDKCKMKRKIRNVGDVKRGQEGHGECSG